MDAENVAYVYIQQNIIQPYKEGTPTICNNMDEPEGHQVKQVSHRKTKTT